MNEQGPLCCIIRYFSFRFPVPVFHVFHISFSRVDFYISLSLFTTPFPYFSTGLHGVIELNQPNLPSCETSAPPPDSSLISRNFSFTLKLVALHAVKNCTFDFPLNPSLWLLLASLSLDFSRFL